MILFKKKISAHSVGVMEFKHKMEIIKKNAIKKEKKVPNITSKKLKETSPKAPNVVLEPVEKSEKQNEIKIKATSDRPKRNDLSDIPHTKEKIKKVMSKQKVLSPLAQLIFHKKTTSKGRRKNKLQLFNELKEKGKLALTVSSHSPQISPSKGELQENKRESRENRGEKIESFDKLKPHFTKIGPNSQSVIPELVLNRPHQPLIRQYKTLWTPDMLGRENLKEYMDKIKEIYSSKFISEEKAIILLKDQKFSPNDSIQLIKKDEKNYYTYFKVRKFQDLSKKLNSFK